MSTEGSGYKYASDIATAIGGAYRENFDSEVETI
jgi:hypothetical protein